MKLAEDPPGEDTLDSLAKDKAEVMALAESQDAWLDAELLSTASAGATHTFVFTHIPPFIFEPDEPKGYFTYDPTIRKGLLECLAEGGVSKWWCGHYHRNAGGWYRSPHRAPAGTGTEGTDIE